MRMQNIELLAPKEAGQQPHCPWIEFELRPEIDHTSARGFEVGYERVLALYETDSIVDVFIISVGDDIEQQRFRSCWSESVDQKADFHYSVFLYPLHPQSDLKRCDSS